MTSDAYRVMVRERTFLTTRGTMTDLMVGEVERIATGKVVWSSKPYENPGAARLQAANMRKRYEHHLTVHGVPFEDKVEAERAAKRAEREAKRVHDRTLRDAAPVLLDLLESLVKGHDRRDEALAVIGKLRAGALN